MIRQRKLKPPLAKVSLAHGLPIYEHLSLTVQVFVTIKSGRVEAFKKMAWVRRGDGKGDSESEIAIID